MLGQSGATCRYTTQREPQPDIKCSEFGWARIRRSSTCKQSGQGSWSCVHAIASACTRGGGLWHSARQTRGQIKLVGKVSAGNCFGKKEHCPLPRGINFFVILDSTLLDGA